MSSSDLVLPSDFHGAFVSFHIIYYVLASDYTAPASYDKHCYVQSLWRTKYSALHCQQLKQTTSRS